MRCWYVYLSGAGCKWHMVKLMSLLPHHLVSLKFRLVQPFWCRLTQGVLEKEAIKWVSIFGVYRTLSAFIMNYDIQ